MANALQHALGYFKRALPPHERRAIVQRIEAYQRGPVEAVEPVQEDALRELLRDLARKHQVRHLQSQVLFRG